MGVKVREKIKGSGVYWIFITHNGKRKSKKIGTKHLAEDIAKKLEKQIVANECGLIEPETQIKTFKEYSEIWLKLTMVRPGTLYGYKLALKKHVLPKFADCAIDTIKRLDIKQFLVGKLNTGLSISTINNYKAVISEVLQVALDDEAITVNPAKNLGKLTERKTRKRKKITPVFFDRKELAKLLGICLDLYPQDYLLLLTLARTGMRKGEAMSLKWSDIDHAKKLITVERSWTMMKMGETKSGKSRKVDMSKQLANELKKARPTKSKKSDFIFPSPKDNTRPKDITAFERKHLKEMVKKAKLPKCRVHDIRHTFASLLIAAGESLVYVRDQLGHSTIQITADTYGHLQPGSNSAAVDQLDD